MQSLAKTIQTVQYNAKPTSNTDMPLQKACSVLLNHSFKPNVSIQQQCLASIQEIHLPNKSLIIWLTVCVLPKLENIFDLPIVVDNNATEKQQNQQKILR